MCVCVSLYAIGIVVVICPVFIYMNINVFMTVNKCNEVYVGMLKVDLLNL